MFPTAFQTYPMGFQSPLMEGSKGTTEPDAEIVRLYDDFRTGRQVLSSVKFRKEVIIAVRRLFGYLPDWLDAQDQNTKISEQAYEMIGDTVDFISTGRRDVQLAVRLSIIATEQATNTYVRTVDSARTSRLRDRLKCPPMDYIYAWINVDVDGFYDMLCTAHAIFGLTPRGE